MFRVVHRRRTLSLLATFVLAVSLLATAPLHAADATFVGVLALAVEKDAAAQLGLSDSTKRLLLQLIDQREDRALELVQQNRDLPPAEQAARLLPFVNESERLGFALLTLQQRQKLQQIRIARSGMSSLGESDLATSLGLTEEQQQSVHQLLQQRTMDLTRGGESEQRITRAIYERKLASLLTETQRAAWEKMAGLSDAEVEPVARESAVAQTPDSQPAVTRPSVTEPAVATPAVTEPAVTEPAVTEPAVTEPAVTEPAVTEPAVEEPDTALPAVTRPAAEPDDDKLRFSFSAAPWREVLEWFAERADLSLMVEVLPVGSFTYQDERAYEVDQALDLLNSYLLTRGYTLVRRERLLLVIDLESPIPAELITLVTLEELDQRGRFELVKCMFPLARMTADEARRMIEGFLGPQGMVIGFPAARQILVTETAGKLRTIRDMIARVEDPKAGGMERIVDFPLNHVIADEVLAIARPLLGLSPDQNFSSDISISVDPAGTRIFATGSTDKMLLLSDLIPRIDREMPAGVEDGAEREEAALRTYYIKSADPQLAYRTVQTMLANQPGVRMDLDTTSGKLVVLARPTEHQLVEDTIAELEGQTKRFEVIQLKRSDPQFMILALNKFFNLGAGETPNPDDPIIDGDPLTMKLWVRGTDVQIAQIRELIDTLEGPDDEQSAHSHFRILPLTGPAAKSALQTVEEFWDRKNRIRMVTPSAIKPSDVRLRAITPLDEEDVEMDGLFPLQPLRKSSDPGVPLEPSAAPVHESSPSTDRSAASALGDLPIRFVSQLQPAEQQADGEPAQEQQADAQPARPADAPADAEIPEIRVMITPNGLWIESADAEALDRFEELMRMAAGPAAMAPHREVTVFYLKYAKAEVANTLLQEVLIGPGADSGDGSLLGDVTSDLLGGGLVGGLLGGLAGGTSDARTSTLQGTGLITVVPDPRLNALIVEANEADLQFVEQLLRVIDRESSITDIETTGVPRLIPVVYNSAEEIAGVVRQVYADRIATPGGQQRQPSPEDIIRALRGQRGGGGGGGQDSRGEIQTMTVGVDLHSNSLIITAPEPLFRQVEMLVQQIDQPGSPDMDYVLIRPIKGADPEVIQRALGSLMTPPTTSRPTTQQPTAARPTTGGEDARGEFFRRLREAGAFGGGPPGGFGGGPPGGFGGGPPGGMMGAPAGGTGGTGQPTTGTPTRGGTTGGRGTRGR